MSWLRRLARAPFGNRGRARRAVEEDLDGELRACLAVLIARYERQGLSADEARRAARLEFGDVEQVKDRVREERSSGWLAGGLRDLVYALRALRRSPGLTAASVVTLALGMGVNAAIFSVVDAVLLRPFPYRAPEQLALVWSTFEKSGAVRAPTSGIALREIRRRSRLVQDAAGIWASTGTLTGDAMPELVNVGFVTPNFLNVLGARPALGRTFSADERAGGRSAMVITDGLWRSRFGADQGIIGRSVSFNGRAVTVVGVLAPEFRLLFPAEANVPVDVQVFSPFAEDIERNPITLYYIRVLARLLPGVSARQAQADLDAAAVGMRGAYSELADENMKLELAPLQRDAVRAIRRPLLALFGGAAFVLLICCTNVANLQLARAQVRRREIALRVALGAGVRPILRQLLFEGALVCGLAGALGAALAAAGIHWLTVIQPLELSRLPAAGLSGSVMALVVAVSCGAAILMGLASGLGVNRLALGEALRETGTSEGPPRMRAARSLLVIAEVTLGFVLVVAAGLMVRSLAKIESVRPGFEPRGLLTFDVDLSRETHVGRFVAAYESRLAALPGVESAGGISHLPLADYPNWYGPYRVEGGATSSAQTADHRAVTPGYFSAMGTRLREGRWFGDRDDSGAPQVAIVDDLLAGQAWPGRSALGKRISAEHFTTEGIVPVWARVVGVVEHVRNHSLTAMPRGEIYLPFAQSPREHLSLVVRTALPPLTLVNPIRRATSELDKQLGLGRVRLMSAYVDRAMAPAHFTAWLAAIFGGLALFLAGVGLYAVILYSVSWRIREMGVRMALGAGRRTVLGMVMREALALVGTGMVLGAGGALLLARSLRGLVYGISVLDPVSYGLAVGVLGAAAVIGCWRPARAASRANPVDALRC